MGGAALATSFELKQDFRHSERSDTIPEHVGCVMLGCSRSFRTYKVWCRVRSLLKQIHPISAARSLPLQKSILESPHQKSLVVLLLFSQAQNRLRACLGLTSTHERRSVLEPSVSDCRTCCFAVGMKRKRCSLHVLSSTTQYSLGLERADFILVVRLKHCVCGIGGGASTTNFECTLAESRDNWGRDATLTDRTGLIPIYLKC